MEANAKQLPAAWNKYDQRKSTVLPGCDSSRIVFLQREKKQQRAAEFAHWLLNVHVGSINYGQMNTSVLKCIGSIRHKSCVCNRCSFRQHYSRAIYTTTSLSKSQQPLHCDLAKAIHSIFKTKILLFSKIDWMAIANLDSTNFVHITETDHLKPLSSWNTQSYMYTGPARDVHLQEPLQTVWASEDLHLLQVNVFDEQAYKKASWWANTEKTSTVKWQVNTVPQTKEDENT